MYVKLFHFDWRMVSMDGNRKNVCLQASYVGMKIRRMQARFIGQVNDLVRSSHYSGGFSLYALVTVTVIAKNDIFLCQCRTTIGQFTFHGSSIAPADASFALVCQEMMILCYYFLDRLLGRLVSSSSEVSAASTSS